MDRENFIPERKQYSIVMLGDFNPEMFQPEWFRRQNVISEEDADFAKDVNSQTPLIMTPQITIFRTPQMTVQIQDKRFEVKADKEPLILLIDFVTKTFEDLGSYTITAVGFNYSAHYRIGSEPEIHKIGDNLAPKLYWEALLENEISGDHRRSGLTSITMEKSKGDSEDCISFTLRMSPFIEYGLMLSCNDHNVMSAENQMAENAMAFINTRYTDAFKNMERLQVNLLERVCA